MSGKFFNLEPITVYCGRWILQLTYNLELTQGVATYDNILVQKGVK